MENEAGRASRRSDVPEQPENDDATIYNEETSIFDDEDVDDDDFTEGDDDDYGEDEAYR